MKQSGDQLLHGPHEGFFTGGELSVEGRPRNGERHSEWKYYDRCRDKGAGPFGVGWMVSVAALPFFRRQR